MPTEMIELLENKKVFERERKPNEVRALGILLVYSGLFYRKARDVLSSLDPASYEAVRKWYHRAKDLFTCSCRQRRAIAIDETKIKVKDEYYYLWAAIDIDT